MVEYLGMWLHDSKIQGGGYVPLGELRADRNKLIGMKQVKKAVANQQARKVYLAYDAEPHVTVPITGLCQENRIELDTSYTMGELGAACEIDVGAAAVALLIQ
jgi:large subunit ribosomal protein L7A